jgi:hypothetical protein
MAFTHVYGGGVWANILMITHGVLCPPAWLLFVFRYLPQSSKEDVAEYMLSALFAGEKGAFRRGETGDDIGKTNFATDEVEVVGTYNLFELRFKV